MRCRTLVSLAAVLAAGSALAENAEQAPAASDRPSAPVYLFGTLDLEKLKAVNPDHYLRAQRILAAAQELCKPGPDQVYFARFEAEHISCEGSFLRTSYPPKQEIAFTLDSVRYVALVTVKDAPPTFVPLELRIGGPGRQPGEAQQRSEGSLHSAPRQAPAQKQPSGVVEIVRALPVQPVDDLHR